MNIPKKTDAMTKTWPIRMSDVMHRTIMLMAEDLEVNAADLVRHAIKALPNYGKHETIAVAAHVADKKKAEEEAKRADSS